MVPSLLLAPAHHHAVLDMCAAPGSKTLHLLDLMTHDSIQNRHDVSNKKERGSGGTGFLLAVDIDVGKLAQVVSASQPFEP